MRERLRALRRRLWRWQSAVGAGALLAGCGALLAAGTNLSERSDSRAEIESLREQLNCYRGASAEAASLNEEINSLGWEALTTYVQVGTYEDPRVSGPAARIRELRPLQAAAREARADAVHTCGG